MTLTGTIMVATCAMLAMPASSITGPGSPPVEWVAPDGCAADRFHQSLRSYLREGDAGQALERVSVSVVPGDPWRVDITLRGPDGETNRSVEGDACSDVSEAAALIVALAIDPSAGAESGADEVVSLVESPVVPVPPTPSVRGSASPSASIGSLPDEPTVQRDVPVPEGTAPRVGVALRVVGGAGGLALPVAGGIVGGAVGLRVGRWWGDIFGVHRFSSYASAPQDGDVGGDFSRWAAGARGCFAPAVATVHFPLCLGFEAGQVVGRGDGLRPNRVVRLPWVAPVGAVGLSWAPVSRLALGVELGAAVPLAPPIFKIEGLGPLLEVGVVALSGLITVEIRLR